jgi:hypothetical protein
MQQLYSTCKHNQISYVDRICSKSIDNTQGSCSQEMRGSGAPIRQQKCDQVSDSRKTTTLLSWVEETWHGRHSNSSGAIEVLYSQSCHNHNHNVTTLHTSDTQRNTQNHTRSARSSALHFILHLLHTAPTPWLLIYLRLPWWYLYVTTLNLKLSKPFRTLDSSPRLG